VKVGVIVSCVVCLISFSASPQARPRPSASAQTKPKPLQPTAAKSKFKAIWEPVNYPQDAELTAVFFVNENVGWVTGLKRTDAGEGGFIIHTSDGGEHWTLQMGDPRSSTRSITNLFFLDPTHGWAGQWDGKLLRTVDAENWQSAGEFNTLSPYAFVSPTTGFSIRGTDLSRTDDAGRSWKSVFTCQASVEVQGLKHDEKCKFVSLSFATPQAGYVTSDKLSDQSSAVFRTADGGGTWSLVSFLPSNAHEGSIGFADASTGFIKTSAGLMGTFDGGQTWKGVPVSIPGGSENPIRFANHEVGWFVQGTTFAYTSNGGKRWNSVDLRLPARVTAFSLPQPDRGYVVGDHGMVYRYRVVPIEYTSKGMIAAPSM
jgi:photosystem II stability/assembly factor-like uncharacterized protein